MEEIGADRRTAWHVLGAVLRTIRDRVPLETAVHLGAQLPLLVRGTYYDQWDSPGRMDEKPRSLDEVLVLVGEQLKTAPVVDVRDATRAVFGVLSRHADRGQVEKVRQSLPEEMRALWPDNLGAPSP